MLHDDGRGGNSALFAALEVLAGTVIGQSLPVGPDVDRGDARPAARSGWAQWIRDAPGARPPVDARA